MLRVVGIPEYWNIDEWTRQRDTSCFSSDPLSSELSTSESFWQLSMGWGGWLEDESVKTLKPRRIWRDRYEKIWHMTHEKRHMTHEKNVWYTLIPKRQLHGSRQVRWIQNWKRPRRITSCLIAYKRRSIGSKITILTLLLQNGGQVCGERSQPILGGSKRRNGHRWPQTNRGKKPFILKEVRYLNDTPRSKLTRYLVQLVKEMDFPLFPKQASGN